MTAIKRTVFLILIAAGCALSAQTYKKSTSCEDMFILACLGDALSVYSSGTKQFIVIREHISDVSIASEGTVLYRDHAKNLFLGKLKQQDNGLSITDEMEIDSTLIDKQTKLIVSNDGGFVFGYKGNIIIIFCLTENKIAKKSELQIEGGIALPSFSPDSKSAAFYNIGRSGGCSVMIFDIASNSVSKLAEVRSHSISLSGEYA